MAKDTFYFSHDFNARNDDKIKLLMRKHRWEGYGLFWAIVEELYNNANALKNDYEGIAFDLRTETEIVRSIINDFGLFEINEDYFGSISIEKRLDERNAKSKTARESAHKRWSKFKENANASKNYTKVKENNANALIKDAKATKIDAISKVSKVSKGKEEEVAENEEIEDVDFIASESTIRILYDSFISKDSIQKENMAMNNGLSKRQVDISCIGYLMSLLESGKYTMDSIYPRFKEHFRNWFNKFGKFNINLVPKSRIDLEFKKFKIHEFKENEIA